MNKSRGRDKDFIIYLVAGMPFNMCNTSYYGCVNKYGCWEAPTEQAFDAAISFSRGHFISSNSLMNSI